MDMEEIPCKSQLQTNSSCSQFSDDTPVGSYYTDSVTLSKLPPTQIDPTWSPGDKIKFRNSKEEAEILQMKLESDDLFAKIKYTGESNRTGQIESLQLIDIMASCNLVRPPILHDSLRRRSFLEEVAPIIYETENISNKRCKKDEGVQVEFWDFHEVLTSPRLLSFSPNTTQSQHTIDAQTQTSPDYGQPWSSTMHEDKFSFSLSWSEESFLKSQKDAAFDGAIKMREPKQKLNNSLSPSRKCNSSKVSCLINFFNNL